MIVRLNISRLPAVCLLVLGCVFGCRDSSSPAGGGTPPPGSSTETTQPSSGGRPVDQAGRVSTSRPSDTYVGSGNCRECHEDFYDKWATSHHGLAMQRYDKDLAERSFTPQSRPIAVGEYTYRMDVETGVVHETGADGDKSLPVVHVMGGKNVFYLLTPADRGRLQVLPVAYDVNLKEWYNTTDSMVRHFRDVADEAVHWSDPLLTFNRSCYSCHVSQLAKNYDLDTDSYKTTWNEPGINCETCHGPGHEHVLAMAPDSGYTGEDIRIISTRDFTPEQTNSMCGSCHAKAYAITASFKPGDTFFDHYNLTTFEDRDWYPDGRDLGENFTYTHWLASPCVQTGELHCQSCHTSSGRDRHVGDPNQACVSCHKQYLDIEASVAHSHHLTDSAGNWCISCHMPETSFARMRRHDHTMLPPSPAATIEFGSPNACNICHTDQTAQWADEHVRAWYDREDHDYQEPLLQRARLIEAARKQEWTKLPEMLAYIGNEQRNEVFATSLIRLLGSCDNPSKWPVLLRAMNDPSPLIRSTAATALGGHADMGAAVEALRKATSDKVRLVRIQAADALASLGLEPTTDVEQEATDEYVDSLLARPDQPGSYYNLGNFHFGRGELDKAVNMFQTALRLDQNQLMSLVNISMAHAQLGKLDDAEAALRRALDIAPDNAAANFNYGLLMAERQHFDEAEKALRAALKSDPEFAAAAYNLAQLVRADRPEEALDLIRKAYELSPDVPRFTHTCGLYLYQAGEAAEAETVLLDGIDRMPANVDFRVLLGEIYEDQQRYDEALRVYLDAAKLADLDPQTRAHLAQRIAAIDQR